MNYLEVREKIISYQRRNRRLNHCLKLYRKYSKKRETILRKIERLRTKFRRTVIEYVEFTDYPEKENIDPDLELWMREIIPEVIPLIEEFFEKRRIIEQAERQIYNQQPTLSEKTLYRLLEDCIYLNQRIELFGYKLIPKGTKLPEGSPTEYTYYVQFKPK